MVVIAVIAALAGLLGLNSFYRVGQGEEALVLTFGRVTDTKGPGLYWKLPLIQSVISESVTTIHTREYGFRTSNQGSIGRAASAAISRAGVRPLRSAVAAAARSRHPDSRSSDTAARSKLPDRK